MEPTPGPHHEEVLWSGSVSHWYYAGRWFFCLLLLAGMVAVWVFPPPPEVPPLIVTGVLAALLLVIVFWIYLDRRSRRYTITNQRVSVEFGIVSKNSNEVRIQNIRSINLSMSGISGLAGIGRVEFSSAATDDADVIFWNVPGAEKLRDMVRHLQVDN